MGILSLLLKKHFFLFLISTENHMKDKKKKTFAFLSKKWLWPKPISELKISTSNVTTEAFQT